MESDDRQDDKIIEHLKHQVRDVPDFPKPGILFKDITPLLSQPESFAVIIDLLARRLAPYRVEALAAIESRGFLFGAALAGRMALPLELVRKPGKLPYRTVGIEYALEYGTDRLEMHADAILAGRRYAVVDDVLATGGTASAAVRLVEQQGGQVVCCAFVIELGFLRGVERLSGYPIERLITY